MEYVVPPSLLFDFRLAVSPCLPPSGRKTGRLLGLPDSARLFMPSSMETDDGFAYVKVGWHPSGLALEFGVSGKSSKAMGSASRIDTSDGWKLWLDTRPSGNVHKATEYCHCFAFLPSDVDNNGAPYAAVQPIAQQRTTRIESNPRKIELRRHANKSGYQLEVWIPGSELYGFREISDLGRLGFYCVASDCELGECHFGVGEEFPTSYDPSTWTQLELMS